MVTDVTPAQKSDNVLHQRRNQKHSSLKESLLLQTVSTIESETQDEGEGIQEDEHPIPRKIIMLAAKWVGCMENGQQTTLDERFVRNTFGDAFADELMSLKRGFVDVPVGDYKVSQLHEYR